MVGVLLCISFFIPLSAADRYQFTSAQPDDAHALEQLALTSHSNYQTSRIKNNANLNPILFEQSIVEKLIQNSQLIGFYALIMQQNTAKLSHFFIKKEEQAKGHGRALFNRMVTIAQQHNVFDITWASDPHAQGFYRKMGARVVDSTCCVHNKKILVPIFRYTTQNVDPETQLDQTQANL